MSSSCCWPQQPTCKHRLPPPQQVHAAGRFDCPGVWDAALLVADARPPSPPLAHLECECCLPPCHAPHVELRCTFFAVLLPTHHLTHPPPRPPLLQSTNGSSRTACWACAAASSLQCRRCGAATACCWPRETASAASAAPSWCCVAPSGAAGRGTLAASLLRPACALCRPTAPGPSCDRTSSLSCTAPACLLVQSRRLQTRQGTTIEGCRRLAVQTRQDNRRLSKAGRTGQGGALRDEGSARRASRRDEGGARRAWRTDRVGPE